MMRATTSLATDETVVPFWLVYPAQYIEMPELQVLRQFLVIEMELSRTMLAESG